MDLLPRLGQQALFGERLALLVLAVLLGRLFENLHSRRVRACTLGVLERAL